MTSLAEQQRHGFQERLARISAGGPNTIRQIHVGPSEEVRARPSKKRATTKKAKPAKPFRNGSVAGDVLLAPIAIGFGAFAVFVGRAAAFQLFSDDAPYAFQFAGMPSTMFMDVVIAGILLTLFGLCFHLTYGLRRAFLLAGFVAMMVGESVLLQKYPTVFQVFYSDAYVSSTLANPPTIL
ncbi:MAG: hypothetical protein HRU32_10655 [Rhodobacteraceae bacterium]|nr:hypothetical protein [Paracoccaceae bacterium]